MKEKRIISQTDESLSLEAGEFIWNSEESVEAHSYIFPTVIELLKEMKVNRVLDLGCGNGALTAILQKDGFDVTGIDPSQSGIEYACKNRDGDFRCLSVDEPLPIDLHGKFDAVVTTEVIEHLLLPRNLLRRAREATQGKKGKIVLSTPYHGYLKNLVIALCNGFDNHWHPLRDYGHVKFFSENTLKELFLEFNISVEDVKKVGRVPLVAKSMILAGTIQPSAARIE